MKKTTLYPKNNLERAPRSASRALRFASRRAWKKTYISPATKFHTKFPSISYKFSQNSRQDFEPTIHHSFTHLDFFECDFDLGKAGVQFAEQMFVHSHLEPIRK